MKCANCPHDENKHCKGGVAHGYYKEESRMIPVRYRTGTVTCHTRHCLGPLCCCVEFVKPKEKK